MQINMPKGAKTLQHAVAIKVKESDTPYILDRVVLPDRHLDHPHVGVAEVVKGERIQAVRKDGGFVVDLATHAE